MVEQNHNSTSSDSSDEDAILSLTDNWECPVCLEICVEPVKTPCNHYFCMTCQKEILSRENIACPLCRKDFDTKYEPSIDKEL